MVITHECVKKLVVPDILNGTECGRIFEAEPSLVGRRIVYEEHFGTICYVGRLPKSTGTWLGVDWDNPNRGRHNGSFQGQRYFQTKTATSGSFVKPEKVSLGASFEEALVCRYVLCGECQLSAQRIDTLSVNNGCHQMDKGSDRIFLPSDTPGRLIAGVDPDAHKGELEYSGFDGGSLNTFSVEIFTRSSRESESKTVNDHVHCGPQGAASALKNLHSVTFTLVPIYRALHGPPRLETSPFWPTSGGALGQYLPSLVELDFSGCLMTRWIDVAEITTQLPWLKSLNLTSNRLRLPLSNIDGAAFLDTLGTDPRLYFDLETDPSSGESVLSRAFPCLVQLILVRCTTLNWISLQRILKWTPSLKSLSIAYNQFGNPPDDFDSETINSLRRLIDLDLTHIGLNDLSVLFPILGPSPTLDSLYLDRNEICSFPECPVKDNLSGAEVSVFPQSAWFSNLTVLGLKQTCFNDWEPFEQLLRFPKLQHLFFSDCPLTKAMDLETARQEILARLPFLPTLNRIPVSSEERRGAELDYLKRHGALWRSSGGATMNDGTDSGDKDHVTMAPDFAKAHPVFAYLCRKHGAPEIGETKRITQSLKEGLTSITFILQRPSPSGQSSDQPRVVRRIHGRTTVGHLRNMVRRLFKLSPGDSFDLVAQGERHRTMNTEILLNADTRELGFYCLEDGDTVFVRILSE